MKRIRRLTFFASAFAGVVVCLLAGCQKSASPEASPSDEKSGPAGAEEIVVLTWENYLALSVLDNFERQTGVKVVYEKAENSRQFSQLLASAPDRYDLVVADDKTMFELKALQLLHPIETSLVPNFRHIGKEFVGCDFDPRNEYSIPYSWGLLCIAYRRDLIDQPRPSWEVLWDESLKGKVTLVDEPDDLFYLTLLSIGQNPENAPIEAFQTAGQKLMRHVDAHETKFLELFEGIDSLLAGDTSVLVTYNCDAVAQFLGDDRIQAFIPEEGAPMWIDSFMICRQTRKLEIAHRLIDFLLEPGNAAATANEKYIPTPNVAAHQFLRPDLVSNKLLFPPAELLEKCRFIRFEGERRRLVDQSMRSFYQRLREKQERGETAKSEDRTQAPD